MNDCGARSRLFTAQRYCVDSGKCFGLVECRKIGGASDSVTADFCRGMRLLRNSMATMSRFSNVARRDYVHIVSTFPAKKAEIFAIFSNIVHLCGQNLIQPEIYTFKTEIHGKSNVSHRHLR